MPDAAPPYSKPLGIAGVLLLIGAFLFCYSSVFTALVGQWLENDVYSYAFLVPLISGYMVWVERDRLKALNVHASPFIGWVILGGGLGVLVLGRAGYLLLVQELSLLITLTGLVLIILGADALRMFSVPIGYLLFMIPIWGVVTDPLQMPSRMFSASLAASMLELGGLPVFHHGIYLELPNITLEVAPECSGINYLFAVAAIGVPVSLYFLQGWSQRAILLISSLVIALLANGLRIALIGFVAAYNFSVDTHGPLHIFQGLFVSVIGYIGMFAVLWMLQRHETSSAFHT